MPVNTWDSTFLSGTGTLSNSNLTVIDSAGSETTTRSVLGSSTDKLFCEFTANVVGAGNPGVGICNATQAHGDVLYGTLNALGLFATNGIFVNLVNTAGLTFVTGNNIAMAIDFGARLVWFRVNGGNWNNSASADPATGAGGVSFATLNAGTYYVATANRSAGDKFTVNFGASAYSSVAPAGFSNWTDGSELLADDKNQLIYAAEITTFSVPARN